MKKVAIGFRTLATLGLALGVALPCIAAPTYKQIPLDGGGWFSGFAVHPSGRLYGYGDVFGVFRSDDSGQHWKYLNGDLTTDDNFVSGMAVARGNADVVAFRSSKRLFTSRDGGATWTARLSDLDNVEIARGSSPVMYHPANDSNLWVAGKRKDLSGSLWCSSNGGADWAKVGDTTFDTRVAVTVYVHPDFPDQVWVGTKGALYVSTNRGISWTQVWDGGGVLNPAGGPPTVKAIVRRGKDGSTYAGMGYMATDIGGYRITATDWKNPATYSFQKTVDMYWGPANATVLADGRFITGAVHGDRDPKDPNNLQNAQRISSDGGLTWKYLPMKLSMPPQPVWSAPAKPDQTTDYGRDFIVQDPITPSRWYVTGGLAPAISTDWGKTWKYVPNNSGIAGVMTYKVNFTRKNSKMALIPGGDLCAFVVTDGGASGNAQAASFRTVNKLMSCHEVMSSDDGKILVAAGTDQNASKSMIIRSTNSGATWAELDLTNSGLPNSPEGITRSAMTPGNPNDFLVVLAGNGYDSAPRVYRTIDGGRSFTAVGVNTLPNNMNTGSRYHPEQSMLLVDGVNTSTRYLCSRDFHFYRSTDNGQNWTKMTHPFNNPNAWIQDLAVDRGTAGKLWALGGWAGIKTSNDGGQSWVVVTGFDDAKCVDAANGRVAIWGKRNGDTHDKLYYSPDNGATWSEATGEGHRYAFIKGIAVDPWVAGKVWVSGISVNVITGLPGSRPK